MLLNATGMRRSFLSFLAVLLVALCRVPDAGATALFTGSTGGLSAQAEFTIAGETLTILLTNTDAATGSGAPDIPAEILTGLFFNLGTSAFTPTSAIIEPGGTITQGSNCDPASACDGETNVGGEWSYAFGGVSWLSGENQGIASTGYLNDNTSAGNFGGPDLQDPTGLNGLEFGVVPAGFVPFSGNGGVDDNALIAGTVKFVLEVPAGLSESSISNVYFTYGTSPGEGTVPGTGITTTGAQVPEPAALALLGIGFAVIGYRMRRRTA